MEMWNLKNNDLNLIDLTVLNSKCLKECFKTFTEAQHENQSEVEGSVHKLRDKILKIYDKVDVIFIKYPLINSWKH